MRFFLLLLMSFSTLSAHPLFNSLRRNAKPVEMTTSIIIPCAAKHFPLLYSLLEHYEHQTRLPNEIVISLCQIETLPEEEISFLEHAPWSFSLKILRHSGKKSAGMNRNIACAVASGDILLCQDADDIPHPQRVEIVKYLFENYSINHLMHGWIWEDQTFIPYNPLTVSMTSFTTYDNIYKIFKHGDQAPHNGNICLLSKVAKQVKWEDILEYDKDVQFNVNVYAAFDNTAVIRARLVMYRLSLSAYPKL